MVAGSRKSTGWWDARRVALRLFGVEFPAMAAIFFRCALATILRSGIYMYVCLIWELLVVLDLLKYFQRNV
jgi:hypothetical protein